MKPHSHSVVYERCLTLVETTDGGRWRSFSPCFDNESTSRFTSSNSPSVDSGFKSKLTSHQQVEAITKFT